MTKKNDVRRRRPRRRPLKPEYAVRELGVMLRKCGIEVPGEVLWRLQCDQRARVATKARLTPLLIECGERFFAGEDVEDACKQILQVIDLLVGEIEQRLNGVEEAEGDGPECTCKECLSAGALERPEVNNPNS